MRRGLFMIALAVLGGAAMARPRTYTLATDVVPARLAGPQAEIVVNNCAGCHSLDYITTQPPAKGAQFWRDAINKMVTVYGAPVDPADVDALTVALQNAVQTDQGDNH